MLDTDTFRVVIYFPDGFWTEEGRDLSAEEAVKLAKRITQRPAVALGIIARVIITDPDDYCVFDWRNGQGVVFPPREVVNDGGR
jgi:hypothetical protein